MIAPTATATTHGRATTYPNAAQVAIDTISVIMPSVPPGTSIVPPMLPHA
jgi:hypothetical protein